MKKGPPHEYHRGHDPGQSISMIITNSRYWYSTWMSRDIVLSGGSSKPSGSNKKFITIVISKIAFNLGHLNLIRATWSCFPLARTGLPLWKLNNILDRLKCYFRQVEEYIPYFLHCNFYAHIACNVKLLSSDVCALYLIFADSPVHDSCMR